ncbi:MAG: helix-turn-helix transcriptional regulator [Coriobacteriaceae bacterium]|nr:helix-turn-helix transcriptional regulator [Coriobacteriaceae bacterium]
MDSTGIGASIRAQREALGMTQENLAQACMVSRVTISNWETGKTLPDIQSLTYLAEVFGVTVDDLIKQVEPELSHRVSIDKRELLLLSLGLAFIYVLYMPLENVLDRVPATDASAAAVGVIVLIGMTAIIIRMGMIFRKHNLSTDSEIADYLVGSINSAPRKSGFFRRHYFELSILLGVVGCLALIFFAGEQWEIAFWVGVTALVVFQVVFKLISR